LPRWPLAQERSRFLVLDRQRDGAIDHAFAILSAGYVQERQHAPDRRRRRSVGRYCGAQRNRAGDQREHDAGMHHAEGQEASAGHNRF
jgi:hypothetical protein